ncbi:MAG: T9SS type A sorting domain-containing protein, partial [Crocinitomicaceae bacterium]|nr:T9SS type A sorting domain-containing protein [Crocinitomicaceae bacterium]
DEGSAELAYGPTGTQSRLAIQYTPYEADSLIGAMIHFVPSVNDVSNNLFLLTIWSDLNGEPDTVMYEDELFFPRTPTYGYDQNIFTYYMLPDTMWTLVTGTFYIGWRQFESDRLNVGLDRNIVNNDHTFYSNDGGASWNQSNIEGSVMIRPIFSTGMDVTLGIENNTFTLAEANVSIFPNPTNSNVTIKMDKEFEGAELLNMQGQVILKSEFPTIDMSNLPNGMYFIKVAGVNKLHKVRKN